MSLKLLYWILMLLWLVIGYLGYTPGLGWRYYGPNLLLFVILVVIGWKVFGRPIEG